MTPQLLATLALGFFLGMSHALDADHVVAVSTMVSQCRSLRRSSLVGIAWGLGHTATLFLVGILIVLFRVRIPGRLAPSMEFLVGILLVALGASVVRGYLREKVHAHAHRHGDRIHFHFHFHAAEADHEHAHHLPGLPQSVLVGMVHGLAGSAALMLLVLTSISTPTLGLVYILCFGAGSILGMLGVSTVLGLPFILLADRFAGFHQRLRMGTAAASVAYGLWILTQVGMHEQWFRF